MNNKASDLIEELKREILYVYGYDINLNVLPSVRKRRIIEKIQSEVSPKDYLKFSISDLNSSDPKHAAINAVSNCKRAIDRQLDLLIDRLGYSNISKKNNWNVPAKIKFIKDSGVVAPRILERINTLRNKLEHDHKVPTLEEAQNAVDVALLFISYAEVARMPSLSIAMGKDGGIGVRWNQNEMSFEFYRNRYQAFGDRNEESLGYKVAYGTPEFDDLYDFFTKTLSAIQNKNE